MNNDDFIYRTTSTQNKPDIPVEKKRLIAKARRVCGPLEGAYYIRNINGKIRPSHRLKFRPTQD